MKKIIMFLILLFVFSINIQAITYKLINDNYYMTNGWLEYRIQIDGKLAYCIEPGVSAGTSGYSKQEFLQKYSKLSQSKKDKIQKIALYSEYFYLNNNKNLKYYYAGQELIWDQITTKKYRFKTDLSSYRTTINNNVNTFNDISSNNKKTFSIRGGETKVLSDTKFKDYNITNKTAFENKTGLKVTFSNNKLTINNPLNNTKVIKEKLNFKKFASKFSNGASYAYYHKTLQDYVRVNNNYNILMEINFNTLKAQGNFEGKKINHLNKPLNNVKFGYYQNNNLLGTVTSDSQGNFKSSAIDIGDYDIKELQTDDNYVLDNKIYSIKIEANKTSKLTSDGNIVNYPKKGRITLLKYGKFKEEEKPLSNIKFGVYNLDNQLIETIITNEKGIATSKELEFNEYYIQEIETLPNYIINVNKYKIKIEEEKTYFLNEGRPIINNEEEYEMVVEKRDKNNQELVGGATFSISLNNKVLHEFNSKGKDIITGLRSGCYVVEEIKPPKEYDLNRDNKQEVCLRQTDKRTINNNLIFYNDKIYSLTINKYDQVTKERLNETKFSIINEDSKQEIIKVTNNQGQIHLTLTKGCYIIKELRAKEGYQMINEKEMTCFDNKINKITKNFYNNKLLDIKAGVKQDNSYVNWLIVMVLSGGFLVVVRRLLVR